MTLDPLSFGDDVYAARAAKGSTTEQLLADITDAFRRLEAGAGAGDNTTTAARAALDELLRRHAENLTR